MEDLNQHCIQLITCKSKKKELKTEGWHGSFKV